MPMIFTLGVLCGIGLARLVPPLWRRAAAHRSRSYLLAGALAACIAAALVYLAAVSRHPLPVQDLSAATQPAATAAAPTAKSMEAEVANLETRLARDGGSAEDWTLLARGYEMLGRPQDAQRARTRIASPAAAPLAPMNAETLSAAAASFATGAGTPTAGSAPAAPAPAGVTLAPSLAALERAVHANPQDAQSWLALAELRRTQHDYQRARQALDKVIALHAMNAQAWADYADITASLAGGSLGGIAAIAIDNALALDPANAKALWLKASEAHERGRYAEALTWWKRLRAALPPGSADIRIIDSNIAEDAALAGVLPPAAAPPAPGADAELSGTVSLDSRFASRVPAAATLFIYAKSADSPGPPLAVLRVSAGAWPVSFRLDDSMAMLPSRRLSQFANVVVEARISRSGQATPSSGDLYVTSPVLHPGARKLALVINREIS